MSRPRSILSPGVRPAARILDSPRISRAGGARVGELFNLRWLTPAGRMRQQFRSARQIDRTAERIEALELAAFAYLLLAYRPQARYSLAELLARLPSAQAPAARVGRGSRRSVPRTALELQLLAGPAAEYVRVHASICACAAARPPVHRSSRPALRDFFRGGN